MFSVSLLIRSLNLFVRLIAIRISIALTKDLYRGGISIALLNQSLEGSTMGFLSRSLFVPLILCRNHQKRIDWSLENHIGNYCNQFELMGQTRLRAANFIPTLNSVELILGSEKSKPLLVGTRIIGDLESSASTPPLICSFYIILYTCKVINAKSDAFALCLIGKRLDTAATALIYSACVLSTQR